LKQVLVENTPSTLRNLSKKSTFRSVEGVFLKNLSLNFGSFKGISIPLPQISKSIEL
jgi:hypothetical protein